MGTQIQHSNGSSNLPVPGQALAIATSETASTVLAAQARAHVEARYLIAIRQPRDLDLVRQKLIKECKRPGFAKAARYKKPIGKGITGPSIRFAEAAIRCMGNIDVQTPTIYDDREKRIMRVIVMDLEANSGYSSDINIEKTVERRKTKPGDVIIRQRLNKDNIPVFIIEATEDDLLNKQNALISKGVRTNGLRLVPGDIVDECMDICVQTQADEDAADPDAAKRTIFDSFAAIGVTVDQLKAFLENDGSTLTPKELSDLRAIYSAIKDGETNWREVMDEKIPSAPVNGAAPATEAKPTRAGSAGLRAALKPEPAAAAAPSSGGDMTDAEIAIIDEERERKAREVAAQHGGR